MLSDSITGNSAATFVCWPFCMRHTICIKETEKPQWQSGLRIQSIIITRPLKTSIEAIRLPPEITAASTISWV
jgi:hypothetical protein